MITHKTVATILADSNGLVTTWDRGAVELVGYQPEEIVGRDVAMIVPEEYRARHRAGFGRAMMGGPRGGAAAPFHLPVLLADQTTKVLAARLSILDDPYGRPLGAMVVLSRAVADAQPFTPVLAADPSCSAAR